MKFISCEAKLVLMAIFLALPGLLVAQTPKGNVSEDGVFNLSIQYNDPDYIEADLVGKATRADAIGTKNIRSYYISYRGWPLMGEYFYSVGFYWERGARIRGTEKSMFWKGVGYPDVQARIEALEPQSISIAIPAIITRKNGSRVVMDLLVKPNDIICFGSRVDRNYIVPNCPFNWRDAIVTNGPAFYETPESLLKDAIAVTCGTPRIDMKWPDDEIDAIVKQYEDYEKRKNQIKKKRSNGAITSAELASQIKAIDAESAAEAEAIKPSIEQNEKEKSSDASAKKAEADKKAENAKGKSAVTYDNSRKEFTLVRNGKVLARFPSKDYSDLKAISGGRFFILQGRGGDANIRIVNANGDIQSFGKDSAFNRIDLLDEDQGIIAVVHTADAEEIADYKRPILNEDKSKFFSSREAASAYVKKEYAKFAHSTVRVNSKAKPTQNEGLVITLSISIDTRRVRRYHATPSMTLVKTESGYQIE